MMNYASTSRYFRISHLTAHVHTMQGCTCSAGYECQQTPGSCTDIDECAGTALSACSVNAACINTVGSFRCTCKAGFLGDGLTCDVEPDVQASPSQCTTAGGWVYTLFLCVYVHTYSLWSTYVKAPLSFSVRVRMVWAWSVHVLMYVVCAYICIFTTTHAYLCIHWDVFQAWSYAHSTQHALYSIKEISCIVSMIWHTLTNEPIYMHACIHS